MVVTKPEDNEDERAIADKPGEGGDRDGGHNPEASCAGHPPWVSSGGVGQAGETQTC